jgi:hypothetical protein
MKAEVWPEDDEPRRALMTAKNKARRELIEERYAFMARVSESDSVQSLRPPQREFLRRWGKAFAKEIDDLVEIVNGLPDPKMQQLLYTQIRCVLRVAVTLEGASVQNEERAQSSKHRAEEMERQTARGRQAISDRKSAIDEIVPPLARSWRAAKASTHRTAEAPASGILEAVNKELRARNFNPVKIDAVARRIRKEGSEFPMTV